MMKALFHFSAVFLGFLAFLILPNPAYSMETPPTPEKVWKNRIGADVSESGILKVKEGASRLQIAKGGHGGGHGGGHDRGRGRGRDHFEDRGHSIDREFFEDRDHGRRHRGDDDFEHEREEHHRDKDHDSFEDHDRGKDNDHDLIPERFHRRRGRDR